jgi:hypothetical protein
VRARRARIRVGSNMARYPEPASGSKNVRRMHAGDVATWLPSNKDFRCGYVTRVVKIKAKYGLWMIRAEHDEASRILTKCASATSPFVRRSAFVWCSPVVGGSPFGGDAFPFVVSKQPIPQLIRKLSASQMRPAEHLRMRRLRIYTPVTTHSINYRGLHAAFRPRHRIAHLRHRDRHYTSCTG